jgi:SH3-like domain-containing protein
MGHEEIGMVSSRIVPVGALILMAAVAFAAPSRQMSVTVRETQLRATPSYLGKILAVLAYGDRIQVLSEQSGWARVSIPGQGHEGWVNLSALTEKRIVLKAGAENVQSGASAGEVALAGKGFNKEVEARYQQEKNLDYTWVDRMEGFTVSPEEVLGFLQQGSLSSSTGGTP